MSTDGPEKIFFDLSREKRKGKNTERKKIKNIGIHIGCPAAKKGRKNKEKIEKKIKKKI